MNSAIEVKETASSDLDNDLIEGMARNILVAEDEPEAHLVAGSDPSEAFLYIDMPSGAESTTDTMTSPSHGIMDEDEEYARRLAAKSPTPTPSPSLTPSPPLGRGRSGPKMKFTRTGLTHGPRSSRKPLGRPPGARNRYQHKKGYGKLSSLEEERREAIKARIRKPIYLQKADGDEDDEEVQAGDEEEEEEGEAYEDQEEDDDHSEDEADSVLTPTEIKTSVKTSHKFSVPLIEGNLFHGFEPPGFEEQTETNRLHCLLAVMVEEERQRLKKDHPDDRELNKRPFTRVLRDRVWKCLQCDETYSDGARLRQHLLQSEHLQCAHCKRLISSRMEVARRHVLDCYASNASHHFLGGGTATTPAAGLRSAGKQPFKLPVLTFDKGRCTTCGVTGLNDSWLKFSHARNAHQKHLCLFCGSAYLRLGALSRHLDQHHHQKERLHVLPIVGGDAAGTLGPVVLLCTECSALVHVDDAAEHSHNCRLPQIRQEVQFPAVSPNWRPPEQATEVPYTSEESESEAEKVNSSRNGGKAKKGLATSSALHKLAQQLMPTEDAWATPVVAAVPKAKTPRNRSKNVEKRATTPEIVEKVIPPVEESKTEVAVTASSSAAPVEKRKGLKVMLPKRATSLWGLPNGSTPPPTPSEISRGGNKRRLPSDDALNYPIKRLKILPPQKPLSESEDDDSQTEEKETTQGTECSSPQASNEKLEEGDVARPEESSDVTQEECKMEAKIELKEDKEEKEEVKPPTPQPPRQPTDWKEVVEPLLYKLLLRVKKNLKRVQTFHCSLCMSYEKKGANSVSEICEHLKTAHGLHLLRGLGEDTQNRFFTSCSPIFMEDISAEEAEEFADSGLPERKVPLKFCVEPLDKTYACDLCSVPELSVKQMVQHLRNVHDFRNYPCLECGQIFKTYGYFLSHLATPSGNSSLTSSSKEQLAYGCRLCGIVGIVSLYMLQNHLRTHSVCDTCHGAFPSQTTLRLHLFQHQSDSPYACSVCQVSYKNYESLEMHLLWKHGTESKACPACNEKTWLCTYHFCAGAPAPPTELDNPKACTVCKLEFSQVAMLKVHSRLHTGERPHKCSQCKKGFISKKLLAKHIARKHAATEAPSSHEKEVKPHPASSDSANNNFEGSTTSKTLVGGKTRKVQQELLKLIGQQNAARRQSSGSKAPSRRVSAEEAMPVTPVATPTPFTPPVPRIGSSIFDIDDDLEGVKKVPFTEAVAEKLGGEINGHLTSEDGDNAVSSLDPLDLLALAATSQSTVPTEKEEVPEPERPLVIPSALDDHDYVEFKAFGTFVDLRPGILAAANPKRHRRKHKNHHRRKKEPRFVLDLSASSSEDEDPEQSPRSSKGTPKTTKKLKVVGKMVEMSESESCGSNCSCSSGSSGSSSSSSSESSTGSSDSSSTDTESETGRQAPRQRKLSKTVVKNSKASPGASQAKSKGVEEDEEVDVEAESHSSVASESEEERVADLESDEDGSIHESDLETDDSDKEGVDNASWRRSPKKSESSSRNKKKKKRGKKSKTRTHGHHRHRENASATGTPAIPHASHNHLAAPPNNGQQVATPTSKYLTPSVMEDRVPIRQPVELPATSSGRRPRARRKFDDDFVYEEEEMDVYNKNRRKRGGATVRGSEGRREAGGGGRRGGAGGNNTMKIKFPTPKRIKLTHTYDEFDRGAFVPPAREAPPAPREIEEEPELDPDRLYCYCRCPYDEVSQMIGCDATDCPYEWFHFECVGISIPPEGKWYCPECRLRPKYAGRFPLLL